MSKPTITHTYAKANMTPAKFGKATGATSSGNKAIMPNPPAPPKTSNFAVPPQSGPSRKGVKR